jgi:hypothetical protein
MRSMYHRLPASSSKAGSEVATRKTEGYIIY